MNRILFRCQVVGVLAAASFYAQSAADQEHKGQRVHYIVTKLGLVGPSPGPVFITNNGLIADSVAVSDAWHAAISILGKRQIDLAKKGGLGGPNSAAFGVNDLGQAAGEAETEESNSEDFCGYGTRHVCKAFIWQNGVMRALPLLKDENGMAGRNALAKSINIWGQVGGVAENTNPDSTCPPYDPASSQFQTYQFKPVIWTKDRERDRAERRGGEIRELPTSGIDSKGKAFDDPDGVVFRINDRGQAVGATGTCTGYTTGAFATYLNPLHATLWQNGSVIDLGNLGGTGPQPPLGFANVAYYVNRRGHVVGTSVTRDGYQHAFFWSPETLIQDVGTVGDDVASVGLSISDLGDIGGVSFPAGSLQAVPTASPRAFIRRDRGKPLDLNSLVTGNTDLYLFSACAINSRGEIIGLAVDAQGNFHGYLATPSYGEEDSSSESSTESRSAQFGYAWSLLRDHVGPFASGLLRQR